MSVCENEREREGIPEWIYRDRNIIVWRRLPRNLRYASKRAGRKCVCVCFGLSRCESGFILWPDRAHSANLISRQRGNYLTYQLRHGMGVINNEKKSREVRRRGKEDKDVDCRVSVEFWASPWILRPKKQRIRPFVWNSQVIKVFIVNEWQKKTNFPIFLSAFSCRKMNFDDAFRRRLCPRWIQRSAETITPFEKSRPAGEYREIQKFVTGCNDG